MEINKRLSENKPYNAWECKCGTITPIAKGLPEPVCEYCRRIKESKVRDESKMKKLTKKEIDDFDKDTKFKLVMNKYCLGLIGSDTDEVDKELSNTNPKGDKMLYKDANGKDIEPEWHIVDTIHCPDLNCTGTLLYSKYYHPRKCSKCGKLWMEVSHWVEVNNLS